MIKILICDGDGTIQLPNPTPEMRYVLGIIESMGITLAVASNQSNNGVIKANFKRAGLSIPKIIVTPREVDNRKKPSPEFVNNIRAQANVALNEIVYIGDDDNTDALCAINAKVLPLAAKFSVRGSHLKYGIPVHMPLDLAHYLQTYGQQDEPYFGWSYIESCADTNTDIKVYALFGEHQRMRLTGHLKTFLKAKKDVRVGSRSNSFGAVVFQYLVSQIYLSGLISKINWICVYPGHLVNSTNEILQRYSERLPRYFRNSFIPNLLIRHSTTQPSHFTSGAERDIYEQFRTIHVNPDYNRKIRGKTVLVIDDFTTSGNSLETARRMLLQAGASQVVSLAIAKYRNGYNRTEIAKPWDPFAPCTLAKDDIRVIFGRQDINTVADQYFVEKIWPIYS